MSVCVRSEIGTLKRILLQRPGRELEQLVPATMGNLLFDDIPFLYRAQVEHDHFAELLKEQEQFGKELTDAVAMIMKKNKQIDELMTKRTEVVRCKDCKHFDADFCKNREWETTPEWYCADGERDDPW